MTYTYALLWLWSLQDHAPRSPVIPRLTRKLQRADRARVVCQHIPSVYG